MSFKKSFLFKPKTLLNQFHQYLQTQFDSRVENSNGSIIYTKKSELSTIIIFKSGVVLFEPNNNIEEFINKFFTINNQELPSIEKYRDFQEIDNSHGLKSNEKMQNQQLLPKSVYITDPQLPKLLKLLKEKYYIQSLHPKKNIILECINNQERLIINKNKTIYSPTGFKDFFLILLQGLQIEWKFHSEDDTLIFVDITNVNRKIGPVVFGMVSITAGRLLEFQIKGLKPANIGRHTDILELNEMLIEYSTNIDSKIIMPMEINEIENRESYYKFLKNNLLDYLNQTKLVKRGNNSIKNIHFSPSVLNLINSTSSNNYKLDQTTLVLTELGFAACSIMLQNDLLQWREKTEHQIGTNIQKSNYEKLINSDIKKNIFKLIFINQSIRSK